DPAILLRLVQHSRCAQHRCFHIAAHYDQRHDHREQAGEQHAVRLHPHGEFPWLVLGDLCLARETDQAFGKIHCTHHVIACIDAGGAIDAFELCSVADVDPRGAYVHACAAIDAIALVHGFPILAFTEFRAAFTTYAIVCDHHAVPIEQHALQTAVWADRSAYLLAHESEHSVK